MNPTNEQSVVYMVEIQNEFDKEVERFVKKKKFKKLPEQIEELVAELRAGNFSGEILTKSDNPPLYEIYKKRLPNNDTNAGKSNGYRVIYLVLYESHVVALLTIYYKKEYETISDVYIKGLIDGFFLDLIPCEDNE
jgi:mRNA-degrading endonuclease RelE of RelBE toxin-antitoxin system